MNIKEIRQLVKLMIDNDLNELDVTEGDNRVHLKRGPTGGAVTAPTGAEARPAAAGPAAAPEAAEQQRLIDITSPMVGTFYAAGSPDGEPYVRVGDLVGQDTVVCIVEAMKVMNEIKAGCAGTIAQVSVENAQPVEFGQVLFRVKPA